MSYKATKRDALIADDTIAERHLMCPAHGCPRKWSVQGDRGKACSAHYWAERADWPRVTADLQRFEVEQAMRNDRAEPPAPPPTREERRAIFAKLGSLGRQGAGPANPKAWAYALLERHKRGDRLTQAQVAAFTVALPYAVLHPYDDEASP